MRLFAKIKYEVLSKILWIKTSYQNLTNVHIMKFAIACLILTMFMMMGKAEQERLRANYAENDVQKLKQQITSLNNKVYEQDSLITDYNQKEEVTKNFVRDMFSSNYYINSLTGYHPVAEQCDNTPDITADGTKFDINKAGEYRYVALSQDLLRHFNAQGADIDWGDYILIKGTPDGRYDGIYQVRDTMNKRHTEWIDILLTPGEQSFYYRNVLMYKITDPKYLAVLEDIYGEIPDIKPLAILKPEI